jgi:hypothetical protein
VVAIRRPKTMKESLSRRVRLRIWVMVRLLGEQVRRVTTRTERIPNLPASIDPNKTRMDREL